MTVKATEVEAGIDFVCSRVRERLPGDQAAPCERFVRQYYSWVPEDDLSERSELDLYGAAVAHWNLAQERRAGESNVRVYNPDFEQDGWGSPHTVIEIVGDDMPFMVDSVTMELGRHGYGIHLVIHPVLRVVRDAAGRLRDVLDPGETTAPATPPAKAAAQATPAAIPESVLHVEVDRESDEAGRETLRLEIERVLDEVRAVVEDWQTMRGRAQAIAAELDPDTLPVDAGEIAETRAFLHWLADDHLTFLGYREYDIVTEDGEEGSRAVAGSGLGLLRDSRSAPKFTKLSAAARGLAHVKHLLVLTKANSRSTVHRPSYLDYIGVKRFGADGEVHGECRFLGLFTRAAYNESALEIPVVGPKVQSVLARAGFPPDSHDAKALLGILETYPRDALFQIEADELFDVATGILRLGERQRLRLFVRPDPLGRFVSCLVFIPRERFNSENRERIGEILVDAFGGTTVDWNLQLSESVLVRLHYVVHTRPPSEVDAHAPSEADIGGEGPADFDVDPSEVEARLVEAIRAWGDDLRDALVDEHGEERAAELYKRYASAFPAAYRADWEARSAVADIDHVEELSDGDPLVMSLYRPLEAPPGSFRCKLFSLGGVLLSDVLPTFEHMGVKVVDERPYEITASEGRSAWIYDFGLRSQVRSGEQLRDIFQETFLGVRRGWLEDDGLNALVLEAQLTGRQITILRAVAKYLRQAGIAFSDAYMERTLIGHPDIARLLVELFVARFDPERRDDVGAGRLAGEIAEAIDAVKSLDEDRILRSFQSVIEAITRTNHFRTDEHGALRGYLSFKLDPARIPILPLPRPRFEIFVYSPSFEGVHLRGGKVARGGLRWSDRREDFRTEILGLMKAQMVKNALIVPVGSKGGFVLKRPPADGGREALMEEGVACYRTFLCGLLDLTDNIVGTEIVTPPQVVRYDDDDPYLVVAADKGTATFSDIANAVSADYGFWLGDAFASGGSHGYDHKAMGITARGAWESVKRHFRELGTDIQTEDFTVVGIGDMSGDVFGNGMLLSPHIRLLAAFNHMDVFLDPNPDPEVSFAERRRLFEQPRSAWSDYDQSLISAGGGVYPRSAKSIPISAEVKEALDIDADELAPTELIGRLLRAPVDLLWNAGIGTYVKAADETHADAGDKANDALRVDGGELRCRVVGEGGNLGVTQRGRIEYALGGGPDHTGGRINTDAIDNVAGVNCSDHEVNIKILLDAVVAAGDMTEKQRNELLAEMTDAVARSVLYGSYTQTQALSLAGLQAAPMIDVHGRLIRYLEQVVNLNRSLEHLPDETVLAERKQAGRGLLAPELAVVMAYCKIHLYMQLLESDLPEDPYLRHDLERYFPAPLPKRYDGQMREHRLRREIIATVVANQLVDRSGTTFAFRLGEETGASAANLARAYAVSREIFGMRAFWTEVESLDNEIAAKTQLEMLTQARRLVERASRWLVRHDPGGIDIAITVRSFEPGATALLNAVPEVLEGADREAFDARAGELQAAGVAAPLATRVAAMPALFSALDIVEVAKATHRPLESVTATYFKLGCQLELNWLRDRIIELPRANRWQALARAALRDDLFSLHRALAEQVLRAAGGNRDGSDGHLVGGEIDAWVAAHAEAVERCLSMIADIRASRSYDTTTLPVALREVRNLIGGGAPNQGVVGAESVTMAG